MKKVATISRNSCEPAEICTHIHTSKYCLENLNVSFIERFETFHALNRFLHFYYLTVFNRLYI